jgi:hypothetical protein
MPLFIKKSICISIISVLCFGSFSQVFASNSGGGFDPHTQSTGGASSPEGGGYAPQTGNSAARSSAQAAAQQQQNQSSGPESNGGPIAGPSANSEDPQVKAYLGQQEDQSTNIASTAGAVAGDVLGCGAGLILANLIIYGFNFLLSALRGVLERNLALALPVNLVGKAARDIQAQTEAHTITTIFGIPIGVSWDAIGWCIVNSIITDIANKTIEWANSGFNGKPAFIQNPERLFEGLADREATDFIQGVAYGAGGINLCEPFKIEVAVGLSESYGNSYTNEYGGAVGANGAYEAYGRQASCSIDQMKNNIQNFGKDVRVTTNSSGQSVRDNSGFWSAWNATRRDENNVWGSYQIANDFLGARISRQQNTAKLEIGMNKGWLNFKKCEDPKDTNSCDTYTPGTLIQSSLEKSLGLPKDRLVSVQKFDQVITAIVNNLIKVALNKVLENVQSE